MFLNALRRSKLPVTIFLTKGVRLQGSVAAFDNFSLELRRPGGAQLLYKHAISTIVPARAPDSLDLPDDGLAASAGLQEPFLASAKANAEPMSLYLINGVLLEGHIAAFDQYCILMTRAGLPQLVYKHAISTLQPAQPAQSRTERSIEEARV